MVECLIGQALGSGLATRQVGDKKIKMLLFTTLHFASDFAMIGCFPDVLPQLKPILLTQT